MSKEIFQETTNKANELLNRLSDKLGWNDRPDQAYTLLRAVLHSLRDRLPPLEAIHLSAQLPILIKGVFIDGWKPMSTPVKMNRQGFLTSVREKFPLDTEQSTEELIKIVSKELFTSVDKHELEKIKKILPEDIRDLF